MSDKLDRKLINLYLFFDLMKMKKKIPTDFTDVKRIQDKRVQNLVKHAYEIPFYRDRFDRAGVKPEDIKTGLDLAKLPLLTKDELRAWMKEEAKNPKYEYWFRDTTSGSTGEPLMVLLSPKEKAYMMANWFRVMMTAGYNPFTGKTMSRKSAHSVTGGSDTFLQKFGILRRGFLNQYASEESMIEQVNEYKHLSFSPFQELYQDSVASQMFRHWGGVWDSGVRFPNLHHPFRWGPGCCCALLGARGLR